MPPPGCPRLWGAPSGVGFPCRSCWVERAPVTAEVTVANGEHEQPAPPPLWLPSPGICSGVKAKP